MTALGLAPANSIESVARTLYDIAQGFDAPVDTEPRVQRALRLLRGIVPNDRCALLEVTGAGPARLVVEPDAPDERAALRRVLTRFLTVLTDEAKAGTDWQLPDIDQLALWASPSHLAVPLVGLDEVLGVLFVRHRVANGYTNDHLRLLSIVASQIATHLTASRLREQQAEIVRAHEAARAEAETEAGARDEFLTTLVHELRGLVANKQVQPLGRLLDGVLEALRVTRDKVELRKESLVLQTIVMAAVATTLNLGAARRHVVSVSLPDEPLRLEADPARLTQVVVNLLENAATHTPAGGEISVTGYREGSDVVLRVRDTGTGIAPERLPRVFDLFARADRSPGGIGRGLGVGLTLARALIVLHGGSIEAHSDGAGRGSEFVVRLPANAAGA
jgi:signal transduction histidine kinase